MHANTMVKIVDPRYAIVNQILAFLNMSLIWVLGVARKQDLRFHKKIPSDIDYLPDTEEYSKARYVVLNKEHNGGTDTEKPSDSKTNDIPDESGLDGAFAHFGRVILE